MKVNTTLRIESDAIGYYRDNYRTNHAGCVLAVESFPYLRDESMKILEGKFTNEEVIYLEKASAKKLSPKDMASRRHWEAEIGDYFEKTIDDSIDFANIIGKIRELSPLERFILRESIISGI